MSVLGGGRITASLVGADFNTTLVSVLDENGEYVDDITAFQYNACVGSSSKHVKNLCLK